jgi:hypothetical protein
MGTLIRENRMNRPNNKNIILQWFSKDSKWIETNKSDHLRKYKGVAGKKQIASIRLWEDRCSIT